MILDQQHNGCRIGVRVGDLLTVRLKENASTGYRWAVENAGHLELEDDRNQATDAPGASGVREFRFRAAQPENVELHLKNWRDWEGDASVIDRFIVHVAID